MTLRKLDHSAVLLAPIVLVVLIGTGCVGPMACGPMGCQGPIVAAHGGPAASCGNSCNGCGERYYDEWINHPPSCNDPCDSCGNHRGQTCHACRPILSGFKSIWGYRCDPPPVGCSRAGCDNLGCRGRCEPACGLEGCDSGCSTCGGHSTGFSGGEFIAPEPIGHHHEMQFEEPSQSHLRSGHTTIVRGSPNVKPYQPRRNREIFQARDPHSAGRPTSPRF
jgi:hypothetical protein